MKVVILAGGLPSTISEEDEKKPKPMVEIGGRPILWHIMKQYSYYGFDDFIICTGYKGEQIKQYFMDYYIYQSDITVDLKENRVQIHRKKTEKWTVSIVDTGLHTSIWERIDRVQGLIGQETFFVVYGDCVSDIKADQMLEYHRGHKKWATVAAARPTGRNAILPIGEQNEIMAGNVNGMESDAWVNACNMVFEPDIFIYKEKYEKTLEQGMFPALAEMDQIVTYKHKGFWSPMETMRDRAALEMLWSTGRAKWKVWED